MSEPTLDYAGPNTIPRRTPLFVVPARWSRRAGVISVLCSISAFWFLHDHMIVRDYNPHWWQWVTPLAVFAALPLAGIAMLRDENRRRAGAAVGVIAVLLSGFLAVTLFVGQRGIVCGENATRVMCASNLRRIGQALLIYSMSNGDALPPDFPTLYTSVPDLTTDAFICVASDQRAAAGASRSLEAAQLANPKHCSFVYLGEGLNVRTVSPTAVVAHERLGHDGRNDGMNVLLGDGRVVSMTPAELAEALRAPTSAPATAPAPPPATAPGTTPR